MAQKRVNKNLVAFLTVMGALLTVAVVAVATHQGARKDPEIWAEQARERDAAGDFEVALQLYNRAYANSESADGRSKKVSYLVESADCAYRYGDIGAALRTLKRAHAERPDNETVIAAYLEHLWDLLHPERYRGLSPFYRDELLEYAEALHEINEQHVLGPVSEAVSYWAMGDDDPRNETRGDTAMQRAVELAENDPRVVLARIERELQESSRRMRQAREDRATTTELETINRESQDLRVALLEASLAVNPGEWRLINPYIGYLHSKEEYAKANEILDQALASHGDDPELHLGRARLYSQEALRKRKDISVEAYVALLDQAAAHAKRGIELEPALYDAYVLRARVELLRGLKTDVSAPAPERFEAVLQVYEDGIRETVGVRSLFATRGEKQRQLMHISAFNTAMDFVGASTTTEERTAHMDWAHKFLEQTEVRYPEEPFTHFMRGQAYWREGEDTLAIQAFERAEQLASTARIGRYPAMWFREFDGRLPLERLALLYNSQGQLGEALRYTDEAIGQYDLHLQRRPTPKIYEQYLTRTLPLALSKVELLIRLDRAQEAYDYTQEIRRIYKDSLAEKESVHLRLAAVEASALRSLGRAEEISDILVGGSASILYLRAQNAILEEDWATAEKVLRELLAHDELNAETAWRGLRLLGSVLGRNDRQADVKDVLVDLRQRFSQNKRFLRRMDRYDVMLSYTESEERDAKLLELIEAETDPQQRDIQLFDYYVQREQYEQAQTYLDRLEERNPEKTAVLERQFIIALGTKQYERASTYALKLAQLDADHADGATYRARLALAQGQAREAVQWYREAVDKLPRSSGLLVRFARALGQAQRVEEAVTVLREAIQFNPRDFEANKMLYMAYQSLPRGSRPEDDGTSYLQAAAKLNPNDPYIQEQSEYLAEENTPQVGITRREERRAAEPENVENLIRLGELYAKLGDVDHASERFQEAFKLAPGNYKLAETATAFYVKTGRREEGEQHLKAYYEAQSGKRRGGALALLARFYEELGDLGAAEATYQQVKRVLEQVVEDPEQRRLAAIQAGFSLIDFYRRCGGREPDMIDACRWALDKLNAKSEQEAAMIRRARLLIIRGLRRLNRLGEANKLLADYTHDYPEDMDGWLMLAQMELRRSNWSEASGVLNRILRQLPEHIWTLIQRGRISLLHARYVEARQDLELARGLSKEALDRLPKEQQRGSSQEQIYLEVLSQLARLYEVTEQYELAETELQEMIKLGADQQSGGLTQQDLVDRLFRLHRNSGRLEKARQTVSEYMARYPESSYWPYKFGLLHDDQGQELLRQAEEAGAQGRTADERKYRTRATHEYDTAALYFERAEQLAQKDNLGFAMYCVAFQLDALAAAGQISKATELYEQLKARQRRMPAIVHAAMIRTHEANGQRSQALQQLEMALNIATQTDMTMVNAVIGFSREYLPPEAAIDTLRKIVGGIVTEGVQSFRLRDALSEQLIEAGRLDEALQTLDPVLAKAGPELSERLVALLLRSQVLSRSNDVEGAIELLEQILETYPDNPAALNNLAYLLADRADRPQEALPYAERARQQSMRDPQVLDTVGWVYFKNGRFDQAEAALREALVLDPENLAAGYHLGLLYKDGKRNMVEARTALRRTMDKAAKADDEEYERKAREALEGL